MCHTFGKLYDWPLPVHLYLAVEVAVVSSKRLTLVYNTAVCGTRVVVSAWMHSGLLLPCPDCGLISLAAVSTALSAPVGRDLAEGLH